MLIDYYDEKSIERSYPVSQSTSTSERVQPLGKGLLRQIFLLENKAKIGVQITILSCHWVCQRQS